MPPRNPWKTSDLPFACAGAFGFAAIGALSAAVFIAAARSKGGGSAVGVLPSIIAGVVCFNGGILMFIAMLLWRSRMTWREAFGLGTPGFLRRLPLVAGLLLVAAPMMMWIGGGTVELLRWFGQEAPRQAAVGILEKASDPAVLWFTGFAVMVAAPVSEELLFRGVLYPMLRAGLPARTRPRATAMAVTAVLFSLMHGNAGASVALGLFSLLLTWLYERTEDLSAPILLHAGFNATSFCLVVWRDPIGNFLKGVSLS